MMHCIKGHDKEPHGSDGTHKFHNLMISCMVVCVRTDLS